MEKENLFFVLYKSMGLTFTISSISECLGSGIWIAI
jgi:hypothetical protein